MKVFALTFVMKIAQVQNTDSFSMEHLLNDGIELKHEIAKPFKI